MKKVGRIIGAVVLAIVACIFVKHALFCRLVA